MSMKKALAAGLCSGLLLAAPALAAPALSGLEEVLVGWDALEKQVRDNLLPRKEAVSRLRELHSRLAGAAVRTLDPRRRVFPLGGYRPRDIGGKKGSGYRTGGYDYYQGKLHAGHPAHDIFIRDVNRDSLDDRTGRPVEVLAFAAGVVVSVNREWEPGSDVRGGKYVWVFDPAEDAFYVYAHLAEVLVSRGEPVSAGAVLGHVGRTGKNAWPRRSPTHLHFARLDFDAGGMSPRDTYQGLLRAELR